MKKQSSHYPKEFKQQAVELVNTGRPVPQVAKELEINVNTLYGWVSDSKQEQATVSDDRYKALQAENRLLKKENAKLKEERTILKKAAAYFALENV